MKMECAYCIYNRIIITDMIHSNTILYFMYANNRNFLILFLSLLLVNFFTKIRFFLTKSVHHKVFDPKNRKIKALSLPYM